MASVELRGLTKRFDSVPAVDGVSLRIEHGLLVCLLGPSGCSKTTTLRLIAGFIGASETAPDIGSRIVVGLPRERLHLFDLDRGRRL